MLRSKIQFGSCVIVSIIAVVTPLHVAFADFLTYRAVTGQSGTAEFGFRDSSHLQIVVTDTTSGEFLGSAGVLTGVGVRLPDSSTFLRSGTVNIGTGSSSVAFSTGTFLSGDSVSGEWGASVRRGKNSGKNTRAANAYDQVSTVGAKGVKRFKGPNRDGRKALAGAQGGLSGTGTQGLGVVDDSVSMVLTIDGNAKKHGIQSLTSKQREAFLASLFANSVLVFGVNEAFAYPVLLDPLSSIDSAVVESITRDPVIGAVTGESEPEGVIADTGSTGINDEMDPGSFTGSILSDLGNSISSVLGSPTAIGGLAIDQTGGSDLGIRQGSALGFLPNSGDPFSGTTGTLAGAPITTLDGGELSLLTSEIVTITNPEPSSIVLIAVGIVALIAYQLSLSGRLRFSRPRA